MRNTIMAEIVGFVSAGAGVLSLAIQLSENVVKIRRFSSSVKNAPAILNDLSFRDRNFCRAIGAS